MKENERQMTLGVVLIAIYAGMSAVAYRFEGALFVVLYAIAWGFFGVGLSFLIQAGRRAPPRV